MELFRTNHWPIKQKARSFCKRVESDLSLAKREIMNNWIGLSVSHSSHEDKVFCLSISSQVDLSLLLKSEFPQSSSF